MKLSKVIDQIKTLLECEVRMYRRSIQAIYGAYNAGPEGTVQFVGDGFGNYDVTGLKDKAGADPSEWPEDLRVQEFPR